MKNKPMAYRVYKLTKKEKAMQLVTDIILWLFICVVFAITIFGFATT